MHSHMINAIDTKCIQLYSRIATTKETEEELGRILGELTYQCEPRAQGPKEIQTQSTLLHNHIGIPQKIRIQIDTTLRSKFHPRIPEMDIRGPNKLYDSRELQMHARVRA